MVRLRFACPSCGRPFAAVDGLDHATVVVRRTCRACRETWQIVVRKVADRAGVRLDEGAFTFLGRRPR